MQITVNVTEVDLNSVVGERYDDDGDRRVPQTLGEAIVREAAAILARSPDYEDVRASVRRIRTEEIHTVVAKEVEAALTEPVNPTDQWGQTTGKPTTLRAEIARIAQKAVEPRPRGSYGDPPALERIIREEVDRALAAELSKVVADEKAKVVAAVRAKAAELIAQAVKEGIGR